MDRRCYDIFVGHTYVGTWLAVVAKGIDRTLVGWRNGGNDDGTAVNVVGIELNARWGLAVAVGSRECKVNCVRLQ